MSGVKTWTNVGSGDDWFRFEKANTASETVEAAGVTGGTVADGTIPDTRHLPYCRAVFAEALRLFPPAWVIGRQATVPTELAGTNVRRSDLVVVSPWVTQRDGRWFGRPDEFPP